MLLAFLAAAALAGCSRVDGEVLRIGHANIAGWAIYAGRADGGHHLAEAIASLDLDVVGVAETCESQIVAATEVLDGEYEYVFQQTLTPDALPWSPPAESGCRYGNALITRSELELGEVRAVELPSEDFTPAHEWDPEEDRWALCGRLQKEVAVVVCTAHLTNLEPFDGARLRQVTALKSTFDELRPGTKAAVLVGDFNARTGDPDMDPVASLRDASRNRGVVHVLVEGLTPIDSGKFDVGKADHDLVWASVRVPSGE